MVDGRWSMVDGPSFKASNPNCFGANVATRSDRSFDTRQARQVWALIRPHQASSASSLMLVAATLTLTVARALQGKKKSLMS
jgi:hypothetical protein